MIRVVRVSCHTRAALNRTSFFILMLSASIASQAMRSKGLSVALAALIGRHWQDSVRC